MSTASSQGTRQPLRLRIDSRAPLSRDFSTRSLALPSPCPSYETATQETPTCGPSYNKLFSAICLYDFHSSDPDHLSICRDDFLDIVKQEETGWWAAVRPGGTEVGWIPASYVYPISDSVTTATQDQYLRSHQSPPYEVQDGARLALPYISQSPDPSISSSSINYSSSDDRVINPIFLTSSIYRALTVRCVI